MSFLNDDTDYEIKEDFKQDAFLLKVDPHSVEYVEYGDVETKTIVDVPLINDDDDQNDDDTNSRVYNSGAVNDTNVIQKKVDQNDEVEITLEVNDLEKFKDKEYCWNKDKNWKPRCWNKGKRKGTSRLGGKK